MKIMKKLPNIMTLLRVVLTVFLNFWIIKHFCSIGIPIIITTIIFLSDFFDGKIARISGSTSKIGAVFDVAADLFYIVLSYVVLNFFHVLPLWFLFIILFKFVEFIATSYFIKMTSDKKSIFIFDFLGRFAVVIFYIIPLVSYISFQLLQRSYLCIINLLMYSTTILVFISSFYRIMICFNGFKAKKNDRAYPSISITNKY